MVRNVLVPSFKACPHCRYKFNITAVSLSRTNTRCSGLYSVVKQSIIIHFIHHRGCYTYQACSCSINRDRSVTQRAACRVL